MSLEGWKYYNHAAIPTTAPHEKPNLEVINDRSIYKIGALDGGKPLFARWITDWDCTKETEFWYVIKEGPFILEDLSKKSRKNIRKSLENCEVRMIDPRDYIDDLWRVYKEATERYHNFTLSSDIDDFRELMLSLADNCDFWIGVNKEDNRIIGYKICTEYDSYVDFTASKYSTEYLKLRVSDALNYTTLDYYLNKRKRKYVSNGSRSILHETNVQSYYEEHFMFRKAYCKLEIDYKLVYGIIVKCLYPFRNIIKSNSSIGSKISAMLRMEEIRRKCL